MPDIEVIEGESKRAPKGGLAIGYMTCDMRGACVVCGCAVALVARGFNRDDM